MKKTDKKLLFVLGAALLILGGCSSPGSADVRQLNQQPVDRSGASAIVLEQEPGEENDLLREIFSVDNGDGEEGEGKYSNVSESVGNGKEFFYIKSYSEEMAQFSYLNQIYRYDPEQDQSVLLYETEEAIWVNEPVAASDSIYWVEYLPEEGNMVYNVMRLGLDTGDAKCIAERNDSAEICLSASDEYVTWLDRTPDGDSAEIVVYDIEKQEFLPIEEDVRVSEPYDRLDIVEGGITYFSEDEAGKLYINRYDLAAKEKEVLLLGDRKDYDRLAGCFSDSEYIGWFEQYSWGPYYLYHKESGTLYRMEPPKGMSVFAARVSAGRFYVLSSVSGEQALYVCDPVSGDNWCQELPQDSVGLRFRPWQDDGGLYLNAHAQGKDILYQIL